MNPLGSCHASQVAASPLREMRAAARETAIDAANRLSGETIDRIEQIISTLEQRLDCVLTPRSPADAVGSLKDVAASPPCSAMATSLRISVSRLNAMCDRLSDLQRRLEL